MMTLLGINGIIFTLGFLGLLIIRSKSLYKGWNYKSEEGEQLLESSKNKIVFSFGIFLSVCIGFISVTMIWVGFNLSLLNGGSLFFLLIAFATAMGAYGELLPRLFKFFQ